MTDQEAAVCQALTDLGIAFERFEHPPVYTVEQALEHWAGIDATHCKNLFLRNKKGDRHYLVVAGHATPIDLATVAARAGDTKLSFASAERLMTHLGLTPGAVSPFGLLNDQARAVRVVIDRTLRDATRLGFHPNVNTSTLVLTAAGFERFLADRGNSVIWL